MVSAFRRATPRLITHPSILALLNGRIGAEPKDIIRELARKKIAEVKGRGWSGPPFCPRIMASLLDIRCKEVSHEIGGDGRILPYPGGRLWIEFRSGQLAERQNFTIFHEITHTLFPDFGNGHAHHVTSASEEEEFERLCDVGASEFLFPLESILVDVKEAGSIDCNVVAVLKKRYAASIEATARRLVDVTPTQPFSLAFLTDQKGNYGGEGPLWIKSFHKTPAFRGWPAPGTSIPPNSVAVECLEKKAAVTKVSTEQWMIDGRRVTFTVQAMRLPDVSIATYPKVLVVLK